MKQIRPKISIPCDNCSKMFEKYAHHAKLATKIGEKMFCSKECFSKARSTKKLVECKQCGKEFTKHLNQIKITKNNFCSKSCAAIYNNAHKKHGTSRSKLEQWLEEQLVSLYPDVEFHFNRKDAIESELDIYIPSLQLAFELNGIFHYEPVFGQDKLDSIQNNDQRKFAACSERNISLCSIDVSSLKYFKPTRAQKYLEIITKIIDDAGGRVKIIDSPSG